MKKSIRNKVYLFLVEGETEEEFYSALMAKYCNSLPRKIINLKGNFNINKKILEKCAAFSANNKYTAFEVFICIDQERMDQPPYNKSLVLNELTKNEEFIKNHDVIAVLMLESLFFIDIEGIYKFLRTKRTLRNPRKYINFRKLTHLNLNLLFRQNDKTYIKGHKCAGFIEALNMNKIVEGASEIKSMLHSLDNSRI